MTIVTALLAVRMVVTVQQRCCKWGRRIRSWRRSWFWWRRRRWNDGDVEMMGYRLRGSSGFRNFPEYQERKISAKDDGLNRTLKTPYYDVGRQSLSIHHSWSSIVLAIHRHHDLTVTNDATACPPPCYHSIAHSCHLPSFICSVIKLTQILRMERSGNTLK